MRRKERRIIFYSFVASILLNAVLIPAGLNLEKKIEIGSSTENKKLTIIKIRPVGRDKGKDKKDIIDLSSLLITDSDLLSDLPFKKKKKRAKLRDDSYAQSSQKNSIQTLTQETFSDVALINSGVRIQSKKGVKVDELNTHELIYYGFKKRTLKKYMNSISKNFGKLKDLRQEVLDSLKKDDHKMRGKIAYDKEGNVMSIKILEWSPSDEIQSLFLQSLKEIRAIPNPPAGIIDDEGFNINYELGVVF